MKEYNASTLELGLEALNPFTGYGGYTNYSSRMFMASGNNAMSKRPRHFIYTTSQLIELFARRGDVYFKVGNREAVAIKPGQQRELICLMSTIPRGETFTILIKAMSSLKQDSKIEGSMSATIKIDSHRFKMLSANSVRSTANLGSLFDIWGVPLYSSQRRSLGLDLK